MPWSKVHPGPNRTTGAAHETERAPAGRQSGVGARLNVDFSRIESPAGGLKAFDMRRNELAREKVDFQIRPR